MSIRILVKDYPHRSIALATESHVLIFRNSPVSVIDGAYHNPYNGLRSASQTSLSTINTAGGGGAGGGGRDGSGGGSNGPNPRCMVEFARLDHVDLSEYRSLTAIGRGVHGTLGLITVQGDVFLCVVSGASQVATVRKGETVLRIYGVEFHCLNRADYDHVLNEEINPYPTDTLDEDGFELAFGKGKGDAALEHPCLTLRKLLSSGTFYYSADFDLTRRLQERSSDTSTVTMDSLDAGFLWNSYMIQPLVDFRSRLSQREKSALDASKMLTSAIRGFVHTMAIPAASSPARQDRVGMPSTLTLISRLSCRRAGTRFNARGIDDDGNVANFVETETIFCTPAGLCFSYTQVRGSVPVFWEQTPGLIPGQQKISITRSEEATQPAFDKHFQNLEYTYGPIHVVNLLSLDRPQEVDLTRRYRYHIRRSPLNANAGHEKGHELLRDTEFDFHAETRGPTGLDAADAIRSYIAESADAFGYYLSEELEERPKLGDKSSAASHGEDVIRRPVTILQQEGIFRTNCLDCLDRTNLVQTIISRMALTAFLTHRGERATPDFWVRHGSLWADNGDALSRIYAGTGALKSSFTRHGKMSLAGALADARKSATRMYINNFADKGRQNTIDMLLGRLMGQAPVHLYDPINDYVTAELSKRSNEYSSTEKIHIFVGTFNLNGKTNGLTEDLSPWLCPAVDPSQQFPELIAIGFQEIVELSPQQIMSTDPARRQAWEGAVKSTLNEHARKHGREEYVLLRGGQLVGASLSVFVRASVLKKIKNVEGSLKKTGMSGMAGNKGAVAIRIEFANTSICFVTAHLAAGFANYEERNRDYKTISQGLRFARNRMIEDHETVIWLGDFNYRIGLSNDSARRLIDAGDLETLYSNDQLNLQMVAGLAFPFYTEARITFLPTYKYDIGADTYDTSEKSRIPAWCDRVLVKGNNLRQIHYNAAPLRFSDHRPVYATFQCTISVIDEKKKEQMSHALYQQRKAAIGDPTLHPGIEDSDDEDIIGYDSIEPGLPPASSDKRKWWLDNGLPARSQVQPPGKGFVPNPGRLSNPWTPSPEPDWVEVRKTDHLPESYAGLQRTSTNASIRSLPASRAAPRKLPAPYNPADYSSPSAALSLPNRRDDTNGAPFKPPSRSAVPDASVHRSSSTVSLPVPPRSTSPLSTTSSRSSRKPAPPVPKKPPTLASSTNSADSSPTAVDGAPAVLRKALPPQLPPARKSKIREREREEVEVEEQGPPLPPRRTKVSEGLMDERDEEGLEDLKGWEVLRPA